MTARLLPAVLYLTRGWICAYTFRLPPSLADARRAEIESDIWEMLHDRDFVPGLHSGWIALARLVEGIPDDLAWRLDNAAREEQFIVRRAFALTAATAVVLSLWAMPSIVLERDREKAACAARAPMPQVRAAILDEVIRCAGAILSPSS